MKKTLCLLLSAALVVAAVTGCGSSSDSSSSSSTATTAAEAEAEAADTGSSEDTASPETASAGAGGKDLTVGLQYDFGDISPFGSVSQGRSYLTWIYEHLAVCQYTDGDTWEEMAWQMAKNITQIDDLNYEVEIYDYIYDTAGNHITADDVAFCFMTQLEKANDETISSYLESCEAVDDYTVHISMSQLGLNTFEYCLKQVCIVSQKAYESSSTGMATEIIATGPYKLTSFTSGSSAVLEKNDNYWQTDESLVPELYHADYWDTITIDVITEPSQMTIALQNGTIDIANFITASDLGNFMNDDGSDKDGYLSTAVPGSTIIGLLWNCDPSNPLSDENLRKALSYAINADDVMQAAVNGYGTVATSYNNPAWGDYYAGTGEYFDYDPDKAAEYLEAAGYQPGELSLRLMYENSDERQKIAQVVQAYLSQIGVNCELLGVETALFDSYKYNENEWDILIDQKGSANGFVTFPWTLVFDTNSFENGTANFIHDDHLQELLVAVCDPTTHGADTVKEFSDYIDDNAYIYGFYISNNYIVANANTISDIALKTGVSLNMCTCVPAN